MSSTSSVDQSISYLYFSIPAVLVGIAFSRSYTAATYVVICLVYIGIWFILKPPITDMAYTLGSVSFFFLLSVVLLGFGWYDHNFTTLFVSCILLAVVFTFIEEKKELEESEESERAEVLQKEAFQKQRWMEMSFYSLMQCLAALDISKTDEELMQDLVEIEAILPDPLKQINSKEWEQYVAGKFRSVSGSGKSAKKGFEKQVGKEKAFSISGLYGRYFGNKEGEDEDDEKRKPINNNNNSDASGCNLDNTTAFMAASNQLQEKNKAIVKTQKYTVLAISQAHPVTEALANTVIDPDSPEEENDEIKTESYQRHNPHVLFTRGADSQLNDFDCTVLMALWTLQCTPPYWSSVSIPELEQSMFIKIATKTTGRSVNASIDILLEKRFIIKKNLINTRYSLA